MIHHKLITYCLDIIAARSRERNRGWTKEEQGPKDFMRNSSTILESSIVHKFSPQASQS